MKKTFVNTIKTGQAVDDIFVARDKQLSYKKDGDPYLTLTLMDRTGGMKAVAWDNVQAISKAFVAGDYVRVKGNAVEYRDTLQLVVQHLERLDPARPPRLSPSASAEPRDTGRGESDGGQVDPSATARPALLPSGARRTGHERAGIDARDFLPATERDVDQMLDQLIQISQTVENKHLSRLLAAFFEDKAFVDRFKTAPAAKKMHHAYLGGLLEHTLSIARLIQAIAGHYKKIDKDLLLTGGILHDIGKVYEFSYETHIDYSDAGRLLNHIVIGVQMLETKIATINDFPKNLALVLKHMIVSHHGTRDFGSPEPPKTLEAIILYYLDELDAKVTGVRSFMDTEDPEATWTSYHKVFERFFYKGKT